jgi:hypothetical protein
MAKENALRKTSRETLEQRQVDQTWKEKPEYNYIKLN